MIHIGNLIKKELYVQRRTVKWFAKEISYERSNIYKLFNKPSIDTGLLLRISQVLDYDFFNVYREEMDNTSEYHEL